MLLIQLLCIAWLIYYFPFDSMKRHFRSWLQIGWQEECLNRSACRRPYSEDSRERIGGSAGRGRRCQHPRRSRSRSASSAIPRAGACSMTYLATTDRIRGTAPPGGEQRSFVFTHPPLSHSSRICRWHRSGISSLFHHHSDSWSNGASPCESRVIVQLPGDT